MNKFRVVLVAVLVLTVALFGAKQTAWAGPAQAGTVNNPSGQDSGPCGENLQTGFAVGYVNGTKLPNCTSMMYKVGQGGTPYAGFSPVSYPVYIGTNQGIYANQYLVTACFPLNMKMHPDAGVYNFDSTANRWFPAPFYWDGAGSICGYWWGSAIFAVFAP